MRLDGAEAGELCGLCRERMNEGAIKCAHCHAERHVEKDLGGKEPLTWLGLLSVIVGFIWIGLIISIQLSGRRADQSDRGGDWARLLVVSLRSEFQAEKEGANNSGLPNSSTGSDLERSMSDR